MAPVLVPDVAQGAAPELDGLRAACREAITRAAAPGRRWIVLGPGPTTRPFSPTSRGTYAGFGVPLELGLGSDEPGPLELPLSLTVGAWLLRDALGPDSGAIGWSVHDPADPGLGRWHAEVDEQPPDVAVLAMGDGSARRGLKAPGYLDERAEPFDARVVGALSSGRGERLRGLDDGHDLLQTGTPVWELLSRTLAPIGYRAELLADVAPYGVGYFVASWTDGD